jgi:hypothetical protein
MKKWVLGLFPGLCAFLLASSATATGTIANLIDDRDEACVLACLDRKAECKAADRIQCQEECRKPVPATLVIGTNVIEVDRITPDEEYKLVLEYHRQLGVDPQKYVTYVTTFNYNPLADLGIELPQFQFLQVLPFGEEPFSGEGVETVVYADRISCTWPKNQSLPFTGGFGAGCRETAKNGTAGWAAIGCQVSNGCCNKAGADGIVGSGVCTVNSTTPGDGLY